MGTVVIAIGSFVGAITKITDVVERFSDPKPTTIPELQNIVLLTARQAKEQFDALTASRQPPIPEKEFVETNRLLRRIARLDPGNGHAIYYKAFITRWLGDRPGSHIILFNYLEGASDANSIASEDDGKAKYCFDRWRGFCKQRAAYAHHVLALDLKRSADSEKNAEIALEWKKAAIKHAAAAVHIYGGFTDPRQGLPTCALWKSLRKEIQSPSNDAATLQSICTELPVQVLTQ